MLWRKVESGIKDRNHEMRHIFERMKECVENSEIFISELQLRLQDKELKSEMQRIKVDSLEQTLGRVFHEKEDMGSFEIKTVQQLCTQITEKEEKIRFLQQIKSQYDIQSREVKERDKTELQCQISQMSLKIERQEKIVSDICCHIRQRQEQEDRFSSAIKGLLKKGEAAADSTQPIVGTYIVVNHASLVLYYILLMSINWST